VQFTSSYVSRAVRALFIFHDFSGLPSLSGHLALSDRSQLATFVAASFLRTAAPLRKGKRMVSFSTGVLILFFSISPNIIMMIVLWCFLRLVFGFVGFVVCVFGALVGGLAGLLVAFVCLRLAVVFSVFLLFLLLLSRFALFLVWLVAIIASTGRNTCLPSFQSQSEMLWASRFVPGVLLWGLLVVVRLFFYFSLLPVVFLCVWGFVLVVAGLDRPCRPSGRISCCCCCCCC